MSELLDEYVCIGPSCAASFKGATIDCPETNVIPAALWIVVDTYPPGDEGLHFACSAKCLREWCDTRKWRR